MVTVWQTRGKSFVQYTGRIGEHGPHDIRRAPDGSTTILVGNNTFIPGRTHRA